VKAATASRFRKMSAWVMVISALAGIALTQAALDRVEAPLKQARRQAVLKLQEPRVPSTAALKFLSLGQQQLVANLLWLQMIQYFGTGNPYGKYPSMGALLDRITELDPKNDYPYEFAMVVLPYQDQVDTALAIGERAQRELPNTGLLTFLHATNYHLNKKDYRTASRLYEQAAQETGEPKAPAASLNLAAVTRSQVDEQPSDRLAAIIFWQEASKSARDRNEGERYLRWADHMAMVYLMEEAAEGFKTNNGHYPADLTELMNSAELRVAVENPQHRELFALPRLAQDGFFRPGDLPRSPVQRKFEYDAQTGRLSFRFLEPGAE
jgi:hypothetical protein